MLRDFTCEFMPWFDLNNGKNLGKDQNVTGRQCLLVLAIGYHTSMIAS
jgi:hypothetical protein